jgi:hypothetical protein
MADSASEVWDDSASSGPAPKYARCVTAAKVYRCTKPSGSIRNGQSLSETDNWAHLTPGAFVRNGQCRCPSTRNQRSQRSKN